MNLPLISIIIPTYNSAEYVVKCIQNLLRQTYKKTEIIVVDDGSVDATADLLGPYWPYIRYHFQESSGFSTALNHGLSEANGDWVAFCYVEDGWHQKKLERQLGSMHFHRKEAQVCFTNSRYYQDDYNPLGESLHLPHSKTFKEPYGILKDPTRMLLNPPHGIHLSSTLINRKLVESIGGFDDTLPIYHDMDLLFRLSLKTGFCYNRRPLTAVRCSNSKENTLNYYRPVQEIVFNTKETMYRKWLAMIQSQRKDLVSQVKKHLIDVTNSEANLLVLENKIPQAVSLLKQAAENFHVLKPRIKSGLLNSMPATGRNWLLHHIDSSKIAQNFRPLHDELAVSRIEHSDPSPALS